MRPPIPVLLARQQDDVPRRITTYAQIQELLDRIEVASKSGHAGDDSAWHLLDELWEGVLRGIADGVIEDPVGFAQWALKGLKSFGGPGT